MRWEWSGVLMGMCACRWGGASICVDGGEWSGALTWRGERPVGGKASPWGGAYSSGGLTEMGEGALELPPVHKRVATGCVSLPPHGLEESGVGVWGLGGGIEG